MKIVRGHLWRGEAGDLGALRVIGDGEDVAEVGAQLGAFRGVACFFEVRMDVEERFFGAGPAVVIEGVEVILVR